MHKRPHVSFQIVAFVALGLFLVGCASPPTPAPSLLGSWVTTVTAEEIPTGAGQYELTFTENGHAFMRTSASLSHRLSEQHYTIAGDRVVLTDEMGSCVSVGFPTGTYKWSIENDVLTITRIDDACYYRSNLPEGGRTWSRGKLTEPSGPTPKPVRMLK